jgi:transcriptional antiterminator RfaH
VSLDPAIERWRSVDGTMGVLRILKANDRPLAAPKGLVETLIRAAGDDGVLNLAEGLQVGSTARIIAGPFADQLVTVERLGGVERVRVLVSMMNQSVSIDLRRDALASVGP